PRLILWGLIMTETAKTLSPAELVKFLLHTIATGGKNESERILELAKTHNLPNVDKALDAALEARKEHFASKTLSRLSSPKIEPLKLRLWSEVRIPEAANDLEKLTYVPGLVGDITDWIVTGARRPNRVMALGVAVVVVGTIIGRLIQGPTGSGTHLYIINLAPTGNGKDWPLQCGATLMTAAGLAHLIGPDEFASSPGFWNRLKRNPHLICFVDELGNELKNINDQSGNGWVYKIIGTLKKCYNAWSTVRTAEKV